MGALSTRPSADSTSTDVEDVHIRNYDTRKAHSLWIRVVEDGDVAFERAYRLRPGEPGANSTSSPRGRTTSRSNSTASGAGSAGAESPGAPTGRC